MENEADNEAENDAAELEAEALNEAQGEVPTVKESVGKALDALDQAESCETYNDCVANCNAAKDELKAALENLREIIVALEGVKL
jgi:hypothetical protein